MLRDVVVTIIQQYRIPPTFIELVASQCGHTGDQLMLQLHKFLRTDDEYSPPINEMDDVNGQETNTASVGLGFIF